MMNITRKLLAIPMLLALLFFTACTNDAENEQPTPPQAETTSEANATPQLIAEQASIPALHVKFETGRGPTDLLYIPLSALNLAEGETYELTMKIHAPHDISIRMLRQITHPDGRQEWAPNREWHTVEFSREVLKWEYVTIPIDLTTNTQGNIWVRRASGAAGNYDFYIAEMFLSSDGEVIRFIEFDTLNTADNVNIETTQKPDLPEIIPPPGPKTEVQLRVGDLVFIVDGKRGTLQTSPVVVDGEPFIPLSFISEVTGISNLDFPEELQVQLIDGHEMAALNLLTSVLNIPAEWNSTTQFIRISVEIDRLYAVEVEEAAQPSAMRPLRQLSDQSIPIDFNAVKAQSDFDLSRALTAAPLWENFSDYFSLGVSINGFNNTNVSINSHEMAALTAHHFNSVTYSNMMKPDNILDHSRSMENAAAGDEAGVAVHFNNVIPGLEFAKANNMGMRGHVLVWHTQTPNWFFREGFRSDGELVSRDIMNARLESYIRQVLQFTNEYYPDIIYAWDVVNEAVTTAAGQFNNDSGWHTRTHHGDSANPINNYWYKTMGPEYVRQSFYFARRYAAPNVMLFYNDYNTFQRDKTLAIVNLLTELIEEDLVDGMGMQSAFGLNWPGSLRAGENSVAQAIEAFSALGIELQMTELTVRVGSPDFFERQAERYQEFFEIVLEKHQNNGGPANITNVTFFGLMDNYLFYPGFHQYYWLFDYRLQPKPAFFALSTLFDGN